MTIFEEIRADHETQRSLAGRLVETEGDSEERRELFQRLRNELEAHAAAEERFFYVPLMEHDVTQDQARHSVAEHQDLDELVEELDDIDFSSPHWLPKAKQLVDKVRHHLDEEEKEVFPVAGRVLSESQKDELGEQFRGDMHRRSAEA